MSNLVLLDVVQNLLHSAVTLARDHWILIGTDDQAKLLHVLLTAVQQALGQYSFCDNKCAYF